MLENTNDNSAGERLQSIIREKPGIRFMELQRIGGVSHGTLQYYMKKLTRKNFVRIKRDGQATRIFPIEFDEHDMDLMGFLRQESSRYLLLQILLNTNVTFGELVDSIRLAPSTVSWHLHRMKEKGIIDFQRSIDGHLRFYILNKSKVLDLLSKHHAGFMDEYVDSFINSMLEL